MYSNKNRKTVATIFVVALACSLPAAAMDTAFSYQARLDDGGSPANGSYDFRFFLYDADAGGSQIGSTLYADDITVSNGLFTVYLDFGSGIFDGDPLWLEVAVRPGASSDTYTPLYPRQAIMASPYSLHSATIEIGAVGSAEVQDDSLTATDLGPGSVGASEVIDNSLTAADLAEGSVGSSEVTDNSLTASDLAPNSVGQSEIMTNAVGSTEVSDGSITAADLGSNSVFAAEIASGAVGTSEIADGSVTSTDIANGTITYTDTNTGSVQRRVTGNCASGFSIRSIGSNGTVTCQEEYYTSIWKSNRLGVSSWGEGRKTVIWMKPDGISNSACFLTDQRVSEVDGSSLDEWATCAVHEETTHWWLVADAASGEDNVAVCGMVCLYWYVY